MRVHLNRDKYLKTTTAYVRPDVGTYATCTYVLNADIQETMGRREAGREAGKQQPVCQSVFVA